jgi:hypothetical protein
MVTKQTNVHATYHIILQHFRWSTIVAIEHNLVETDIDGPCRRTIEIVKITRDCHSQSPSGTKDGRVGSRHVKNQVRIRNTRTDMIIGDLCEFRITTVPSIVQLGRRDFEIATDRNDGQRLRPKLCRFWQNYVLEPINLGRVATVSNIVQGFCLKDNPHRFKFVCRVCRSILKLTISIAGRFIVGMILVGYNMIGVSVDSGAGSFHSLFHIADSLAHGRIPVDTMENMLSLPFVLWFAIAQTSRAFFNICG